MKKLEDDFLGNGMQLLLAIHLDENDDIAIYANKSSSRIKESQKTIVVHIFKISKPFIDKTRMVEKKPNIYIEFEGFIGILKS